MNKSSRILWTSYGKQGVVELPYFLCTSFDVNISNFNVLCNIFSMYHAVFYFLQEQKIDDEFIWIRWHPSITLCSFTLVCVSTFVTLQLLILINRILHYLLFSGEAVLTYAGNMFGENLQINSVGLSC